MLARVIAMDREGERAKRGGKLEAKKFGDFPRKILVCQTVFFALIICLIVSPCFIF